MSEAESGTPRAEALLIAKLWVAGAERTQEGRRIAQALIDAEAELADAHGRERALRNGLEEIGHVIRVRNISMWGDTAGVSRARQMILGKIDALLREGRKGP